MHKHRYKFKGRIFSGAALGWRCEICDDGQMVLVMPFYGSMIGLEFYVPGNES